MRVRIANEGTTASDTLAVVIYRPDQAPGEPDSLTREHTLRPGESAVFDLPPQAALAVR